MNEIEQTQDEIYVLKRKKKEIEDVKTDYRIYWGAKSSISLIVVIGYIVVAFSGAASALYFKYKNLIFSYIGFSFLFAFIGLIVFQMARKFLKNNKARTLDSEIDKLSKHLKELKDINHDMI